MKHHPTHCVLASLLLSGAAAAHICVTTTFTSNLASTGNGWVTASDVTVSAAGGLTVDSIDINTGTAPGTPIAIDVYTTATTYKGKETNPGSWTLVSSGMAIAQGAGQLTLFNVSDFSLPFGKHGLAIHYRTATMLYTAGTGMNQQVGDANMQIDLGAVIPGLFTGTVQPDRVGNFTLCYDLDPPGDLTPYCIPKVNSLNCTPAIGANGTPSASATSGFTVECVLVRNNKSGLLFYKTGGTQAGVTFQCGTLCVGPSGIKRTPAQSAGGNPAPNNDCSGKYSLDVNAFAAGLAGGNPDPALQVAGTLVHCQWWGRDQGFNPPCNTTLSNGGEYTVQP